MLTELRKKAVAGGGPLSELTLRAAVRYSPGDRVEAWLSKLLCLDCADDEAGIQREPPPAKVSSSSIQQ